ncbi:hypothetical protein Verru16b_01945 [Lacunisphaera limnophila]|uniref:Uncharacterized protein n=1 Tax=Lacunisphaera limnophila TaxID=1838286 RepID=A0A1D8AVJ2_9BACT|nr:hypothetical protein [Lacunisphaera limnophila]AOS44876.1 hypothetical protein Verru16b_01945 [Lacunisphaera limnophila]
MRYGILAVTVLTWAAPLVSEEKDGTVATAVYANIGNGYQRVKAKDGSYKPEYYALSNGGRIYGTISDITVDRVTYPEVTKIAMELLAQQNYHYAKSKEQAKLLLVLNWGGTLAPNGMHQQLNIASARIAMRTLQILEDDARTVVAPTYVGEDVGKNTTEGRGRSIQWATNEEVAVTYGAATVESGFLRGLVDDRVRDQLNEQNARVLGYLDDLADSNDIRRWAGGGDRYNDLITDVEECRYYIVVSAYDFPELLKTQKKKLLWQTRVSVRSPGNAFDESVAAMLKSASAYFGQNSGKLVRGEETKGTVELGELKYLGEAKAPEKTPAKEKK